MSAALSSSITKITTSLKPSLFPASAATALLKANTPSMVRDGCAGGGSASKISRLLPSLGLNSLYQRRQRQFSKVRLNTGCAYNARAPIQSDRSPHAETKSDCGD